MKTLRLVGTLFAAVGALLAAVACGLALYDARSFEGRMEAAGRVVANDYESGSRRDESGGYRAVVRFSTPDGAEHEIRSRVRSSPPAFDVGESVSVRYDPAAPQLARIDSFLERWFAAMICSLLAVVFGGIGGGLLIYLTLARRRDDRLRLHGERRPAEIVGVNRNPNVRFNSQAAWRVEAEWTELATGKPVRAQSRNLDFDPSRWLGEGVDVFVDPRDPKRILVDSARIEAAAGH